MRFVLAILFFARAAYSYEPFIVFLVEARGLDTRDSQSFFQTVAKHPRGGGKNGDVGHAWIYLEGMQNNRCVYLEGGHSGERGVVQPKYFDGVLILDGRGDPNPIRYLATPQRDGFFEWHGGGHRPTYAAKKTLTQEQFERLLTFAKTYPYHDFCLLSTQCTRFVVEAAKIVGIVLDDSTSIAVNDALLLRSCKVRLWSDPKWCQLRFGTPDQLERSLQQQVATGELVDARAWYRHRRPPSLSRFLKKIIESLLLAPDRISRHLSLK